MKTIFITVFQSFISRSILGTDAFKVIKDNPDTRIVIFAPHYKKEFYREQFDQDNIIVEGINNDLLTDSADSFFQKVAILMLPTFFVRTHFKSKSWHRPHVLVVDYIVNYLVVPFGFSKNIFRFFDQKFTSTALYDGFFEKYKPDIVFATDIFGHADAVFLMAAQRHGVPAVGMVRSWDCTTNKNLLRVMPSEILVNNEQVKEELIRLHGVERKIITPVGFAQFDVFVRGKPSTREDFFKKINVDPSKRLILFAPAGKWLTDIDWQYCDILRKAMDSGILPGDLHFLIRNHPQGPADFSKIEGDSRFSIEHPGILIAGGRRATEMSQSDIQHAFDSMYHCEVLISVNTSLGLDILHFNKPHIMLGFDGYEKRPFLQSVRRFHEEDNMKDFIKTGAVRVARTSHDLFRDLNAYLQDPHLDQIGRDKARTSILFKDDGLAGKRIGDFVVNKFNETAGVSFKANKTLTSRLTKHFMRMKNVYKMHGLKVVIGIYITKIKPLLDFFMSDNLKFIRSYLSNFFPRLVNFVKHGPEPVTQDVKIGNVCVGRSHPCFFVAEVGINHNGNLNIAKQLIDAASQAGVHAVKFQKRTVPVVYSKEELAKPRQVEWSILENAVKRGVLPEESVQRLVRSDYKDSTNGDLKWALEFTENEYREIFNHAKSKNLLCFASPWDNESVDFLEKFDPPCYKIASPMLTNDDLLEKIKAKNKPIIMSTGMSTMDQIRHAVKTLGDSPLILLHAVSTYPANEKELNLRAIAKLKKEFPKVPIGYSGHETGISASLAAAVIGAHLIERHITLDKKMFGTDQAASLEPDEFARLISNIDETREAHGTGAKNILDSEIPILKKLRKK